MSAQPDDLDRRLLALLQANARLPASTLAKKLGVARTTVVARIARLERTGVIKGYGLRLGQRPEDGGIRALCALQVEPRSGPSVVKRLAGIPEIEPHYQIVVDRKGYLDIIEVWVEVGEDIFAETMGDLERFQRGVQAQIYNVLNIQVAVKLKEPKAIQRSEGKAVRVVDRRKPL